MENASKALIMAAEILVGVMIISIGVYLFNVFGKYSADTTQKIYDAQIAEFNNQFLKFYGERINADGKSEPIKVTIHDIASLANLAQKNNIQYEITNEPGYSENTYYIQIDCGNKKNLEKYTNDKLVELIKANDIDVTTNETKYYKCVEYNVNEETTKTVNYMKFVEIQ